MTELETEASSAPDDATADAAPPDEGNRSVKNLIEWIAIVAGALAVALVVKTFLIQAFFIPSLSMFSTLDEGDRVLVNKLSYRLHDINRGDLVVFERPPGQPESRIKDLIKRVVGLPGETVEARRGSIYIDGKKLDEPYLDPGITTETFEPVKVPIDHIFVMGDNRDDSADSRVFGPIEEDTVVGRAFIRVWPLDDLTLL